MGQVWFKKDDDTWVPGKFSRRSNTGWSTGKIIYRKANSTTWTNIVQADTTPPTTPAAPVMTINTTTKVTSIKVTAPSDADIVRGVLKWGRTGYATSPTDTTDGMYFNLRNSMPQADGQSFSDFTLNPGEVKTKVTGASEIAGSTEYVTFWVQDSSYNWSQRAIASVKIPTPVATTPAVVNKTATYSPIDSGSWNDQSDYWRTDNNYVYQGGLMWVGNWFYGTQISSALAHAKTITKMTIKITRANTVHGVPGAAQVWLTAHKLATQPSGNPAAYDSTAINVGSLGRGQSLTFNVPSAWWPYFLNGTYKGFGLYAGTTSFTDVKYMYAYGNAAVHIEWTQ